MPMRHVSYPCCPGSVLLLGEIALRLQAGRSLTEVSNQLAYVWRLNYHPWPSIAR